eukprot:gene9953-7318_t
MEQQSHIIKLKEWAGGGVDVVVDDGGHAPTMQPKVSMPAGRTSGPEPLLMPLAPLTALMQRNSLAALFAGLLLPGGVYAVEDLETSYWAAVREYGHAIAAGLGKCGTFIETLKQLVDVVNLR